MKQFEGEACEKRKCPNNCQGNGECLINGNIFFGSFSQKKISILDRPPSTKKSMIPKDLINEETETTKKVEKKKCKNNCSGNGKCKLNGECICDLNWIGEDCSKKVCLEDCNSN